MVVPRATAKLASGQTVYGRRRSAGQLLSKGSDRKRKAQLVIAIMVMVRARRKFVLPTAAAKSSLSRRPIYRPRIAPGANARNVVFKGK